MSMVEKVARAICEAEFEHGCGYPDCPCNDKGDTEKVARAAIEAMQTPTQQMLDAGANSGIEWRKPGKYVAEDVWQAMIDAALEEREGGK